MKAFFSQQYISFTATHAILNKCHNPSIYNCYFFHVITKNDINKHVHNTLIEYNETPRSRNKWYTLYNVLSFDWKKKNHGSLFKYTRDTYNQWLQTKIIVHWIIATNTLLF